MKTIEVKTQQEFDSLPDSFKEETDIHILKGATVKVKGGKENGLVCAHEGSHVVAVWSSVDALKGSRVDAFEGSSVQAHEGSIVYVYEGSCVFAFDGSYVFAFEGSSVSAFDGSDVYAHEGSTVTAFAGSDVKYLNPVI